MIMNIVFFFPFCNSKKNAVQKIILQHHHHHHKQQRQNLFIQFNIRGVHTSAKAVTEEKKIL